MSGGLCELCGHKVGTEVHDLDRALHVMSPVLLGSVHWVLCLFSTGHLEATTEEAKRVRAHLEELVSIIEKRRKL